MNTEKTLALEKAHKHILKATQELREVLYLYAGSELDITYEQMGVLTDARDALQNLRKEIKASANKPSWSPTHKIHHNGETILVMACNGPAYTEQEWRDNQRADYTQCLGENQWTFNGRLFDGIITKL